MFSSHCILVHISDCIFGHIVAEQTVEVEKGAIALEGVGERGCGNRCTAAELVGGQWGGSKRGVGGGAAASPGDEGWKTLSIGHFCIFENSGKNTGRKPVSGKFRKKHWL